MEGVSGIDELVNKQQRERKLEQAWQKEGWHGGLRFTRGVRLVSTAAKAVWKRRLLSTL